MNVFTTRVATASAHLALVASVFAADPVGWRTDGSGLYPSAQPPLLWSATSNVVWKTALPAGSNATPVPIGDSVLICAEPATLLCLSAADGSIRWQKANTYEDILDAAEVARMKEMAPKGQEIRKKLDALNGAMGQKQAALRKTPDDAALKDELATLRTQAAAINAELKPYEQYMLPSTHAVTGLASPTPVTDGKDVFAVFGNGVVAAYSLAGERRWARIVDRPAHGWGHSASPVLADGKLLVHFRKLTALDTQTGAALWQADVPAAFGSPVATRIGADAVVITPSGAIVRASDGSVLKAQVSKLDYCAPVVQDGIVYFIENGGGAFRLPSTLADPFAVTRLWSTQPPKERYYASPVVRDGLIYAINQKYEFSAIDATNGVVVYTEQLPFKGTAYPSIASAGGYIFVSGDDGATVVVAPGRTFKSVARNSLEPFRSSPVFAGARFYVRTVLNLFCIGK